MGINVELFTHFLFWNLQKKRISIISLFTGGLDIIMRDQFNKVAIKFRDTYLGAVFADIL